MISEKQKKNNSFVWPWRSWRFTIMYNEWFIKPGANRQQTETVQLAHLVTLHPTSTGRWLRIVSMSTISLRVTYPPSPKNITPKYATPKVKACSALFAKAVPKFSASPAYSLLPAPPVTGNVTNNANHSSPLWRRLCPPAIFVAYHTWIDEFGHAGPE